MLPRFFYRRRIVYILAAFVLMMSLLALAGDAQWGPYIRRDSAIRLELAYAFKFGQHDHAALSPDGSTMALAKDDALELWDVASQTRLRRIQVLPAQYGNGTAPVYSRAASPTLRWSPHSRRLAMGGIDFLIRVLNTTTGQVQRSVIPSRGSETALPVEWSPDGRILVVQMAGEDNRSGAMPRPVSRISYWNVEPGTGELTPFERDPSTINTSGNQYGFPDVNARQLPRALAWSPDGAAFVSYRSETKLGCWDAYSGETTYEMPRSGAVLANWSANGRTVAYADEESSFVRLADCKAGQDRGTLPPLLSSTDGLPIRGLSWSPDGRTLATYTEAGLKLWQKDGSLRDVFPQEDQPEGGGYYSQQPQVELNWSRDGSLIATSEDFGPSQITKVWDLVFGGPPQMLVTTGAEQVMWAEASSELLVVYGDRVESWRVVRNFM